MKGHYKHVSDEIRDELGWALNNREEFRCQRPERPVMHITSMSKDPCAEDFAINRYSAKNLPQEVQPASPPPSPLNPQGGLFG